MQNGSLLCLGWIARYTGIGKWLPYGGSSQNEQVFPLLERIEPVFNAFQWFFLKFRLMTISLYSDFAGTDYCRQAGPHCK